MTKGVENNSKPSKSQMMEGMQQTVINNLVKPNIFKNTMEYSANLKKALENDSAKK